MIPKATLEMLTESLKSTPPPPTMPLPARFEQLKSINKFLKHTLGMTKVAAAATTLRWERHDSQAADMSTFIHNAIESQIDDYRKQSFSKFGIEIAVFPPAKAKRQKVYVQHFGNVVVGYHSYEFQPNHNTKPSKTLRVHIFQGTVQVHFCGSWQPVSAYLDEVGTHRTYKDSPQNELDRHYYWWRANGKSFDIMKLPGELRNAIFDSVFPSEARPFPASRCRGRGPMVPTYRHPCTALMRTNRQMRREAGDRFYQMTTFLIEYRQLFSPTLNNRILAERLRHVRLELTHSGYLDLFHFEREDETTEPYVTHRLRDLSNLTSLEIHIAPPSRATEKTWLEGACQKTAVDLIVNAAWPSIRGLPVTFTGFIKDNQKKAIQARVQAEKALYDYFKAYSLASGNSSFLRDYHEFADKMMAEEQGGVRLDGRAWGDEKEKAEWECVSGEDLEAALWCSCKTRCTWEEWDPRD